MGPLPEASPMWNQDAPPLQGLEISGSLNIPKEVYPGLTIYPIGYIMLP